MSFASRRRVLLVNFSLVVGPILALEVLARLAGFVYNDFRLYYLFYGFDSPGLHLTTNVDVFDGYFKFQPGVQVTQGPLEDLRIPSQINNIGLRGKSDVVIDKPDDLIRIISLGGSSTFGYHARDEYTYPYLLEKKLREKNPDWNIQVINAGVPNYDSSTISAIFTEELADYRPDAITLYTAYNDAVAVLDANWPQRVSRWLYDHVAVYVAMARFLKSVMSIELYSKWTRYVAAPTDHYVDQQISLHVDRYRHNVGRIVDLAREVGSLVVLIRQPMGLTYRATDNRLDYEQTVQAARSRLAQGDPLADNEITLLIHSALLDVLDEFAAEEDDVILVDNVRLVDAQKERLLTYVHLSEEGNDALAGALAGALAPRLAERFPVSEARSPASQ
ncbi:MAG: GDSL-type esterase/lipase family protein [Kiloniellales bacterium]|nr:GDSL-type esterase/lipase family protein [Kiloniellales bacterium]